MGSDSLDSRGKAIEKWKNGEHLQKGLVPAPDTKENLGDTCTLEGEWTRAHKATLWAGFKGTAAPRKRKWRQLKAEGTSLAPKFRQLESYPASKHTPWSQIPARKRNTAPKVVWHINGFNINQEFPITTWVNTITGTLLDNIFVNYTI